jgi:phosphatidylinositol 4-kinase
MDSDAKEYFYKVDGFYEDVTSISAKLRPGMPKPQKKALIKEEAVRINQELDASALIYMITNPHYRIVRVDQESG